jgi:hypothetical protein
MTTRVERERELTAILSSPVGRNKLLELLRQQLNLTAGQVLPVGTPIVKTILDHEFADLQA